MHRLSRSKSVQPLIVRKPQAVHEREILRLATTLGGIDGSETTKIARNQIIAWVRKRVGDQLPPEAWNHESFEYFAGGRNCAAVRIDHNNIDIWVIRADDPDQEVAQRVWTTEVGIVHQVNQEALMSVRLLVSSPERNLAIEPTVPGFVQQLASECGLYHRNSQLNIEPWVIQSNDDAHILIEKMIDIERRIPIFALSVPEYDINPVLNPSQLARATLGIATIVILPAPFTWVLTKHLGKQLSVYNGAVRTYLPGFTEDADPYRHKLVLAENISNEEDSSRISILLRQIAANESLRQMQLDHDVLSYAAVREHSLSLESDRLEQEGASDKEQLRAAQKQIRALRENLKKNQEDQQWLSDQHKEAEARAETAEAQQNSSSFRIQQLLDQIKKLGDAPDANIPPPSSWEEFVEWCENNLIGRVLLSPNARQEINGFPVYKDVEKAAKCLLWLANEYRERRVNGGGDDLRDHIMSGIHNTPCGSDSFQFDWRGNSVDVEWHIKNGGNTRNPEHCLRIYYFWHEESQQVIIAKMPAHVPNSIS